MGRRWTDQDVEELRRLLQHYPVPRVAELTDRTVGGVTFKAHQLRLPLKSRRQESADPGPAGFDWYVQL
jgi:hypothetical protein